MICSMRLDGSTACMAVEGATDTELFRAYVRRVLCPTLRTGDVVIMDNLSPHKSAETLGLIQKLGAHVLFLPAYSPDLNPIEKMWSKLKGFRLTNHMVGGVGAGPGFDGWLFPGEPRRRR